MDFVGLKLHPKRSQSSLSTRNTMRFSTDPPPSLVLHPSAECRFSFTALQTVVYVIETRSRISCFQSSKSSYPTGPLGPVPWERKLDAKVLIVGDIMTASVANTPDLVGGKNEIVRSPPTIQHQKRDLSWFQNFQPCLKIALWAGTVVVLAMAGKPERSRKARRQNYLPTHAA